MARILQADIVFQFACAVDINHMNRITITGADGFIGRRLVKHLRTLGHEVAALLHGQAPNRFSDDLPILRGDVTIPESLAGLLSDCDLVIHLAGITIARSGDQYDLVNRQGTQNIARECARQTTPPRLLFVSSLAAAGPASPGRPLVETDPLAPVSHYGRSKRDAEVALRNMSGELPVQIVRPPSVFGDTDPYLLGMFKMAKFGWMLLPGSATPRYSLIHVDDLVAALGHLAEQDSFVLGADDGDQDSNPGVAFLAQNPQMSFPEMAAVICETLGRQPPRCLHIPSPLCWALAGTNSMLNSVLRLRLLMNMDKMREGLAGDWMCDASRLTDQLGFKFPVPLEQRIRETTDCYQSKGWL